MVNIIRRFQQPLMILITVVVIIAFAWLYNDTRLPGLGADRVGTIYGRQVPAGVFQRETRKYELCQYLLPEVWQALSLPAQSVDEAMNNYVWNSMVLRHESDRLGVVPAETEIEEAIKALPAFAPAGRYDSSKYNLFLQNALTPRGLLPDAIEELVRDSLHLGRLKLLLGATLAPAPSEVRAAYETRHRKLETSVIRWNFADFLNQQQVSDEDQKKAYEERKATLMTDELRKVRFVAFTLPASEKPLIGKERVDLLAQRSEKAQEFAVAMTQKEAKLDELAAKFEVKVEESPAFPANEPPKELGTDPKCAAAAFKLSKEDPNSDPVQTEKGYYILQLAETVPAREKTFDEAKVALAEELKNERALEAMSLKATEARNKIDAEVKGGKTFAEAAQAAGVKAEAFPPFSLSEPLPKEPDANAVRRTASQLSEGELSSFVPTGPFEKPAGGVLIRLEKKLPIDEAKFEEGKAQLAEQLARSNREAVFSQWLKLRRADAGLQQERQRG